MPLPIVQEIDDALSGHLPQQAGGADEGNSKTENLTKADMDTAAARRASPAWQAAEKAMMARNAQASQRVKAMDQAGGTPALRTDPNNYGR